MYKKLLISLGILFMGIAAFFLHFGSLDGFAASWHAFSNGSEWLPFSPYNTRIENFSSLKRYDATQVVLEDQSLFWKGKGAVVDPKLDDNGKLQYIVIKSGGYGYGPVVSARIIGAGSDQFQLGEVVVVGGHIQSIEVLRTATWYDSPRAFVEGEELPYSGTAEIKYRNGQLMEIRQYLEGQLHGKWQRWRPNGIPLFEKRYVHGQKHGSHMEWYGEPNDPSNYKVSTGSRSTRASLWLEVNEMAGEEFRGSYQSQELNDWIIETYQNKGGSFGPKSVGHYTSNRPHGLFESFDKNGERISKDEYRNGKRTSHKSFDPGQKWKVPNTLSTWAK